MPTPGQQQLFERLQREHGQSSRWEFVTRGVEFEAMNTHRAGHFLAGLLTTFLGARSSYMCCTRSPERYYPEFRSFSKAPGGEAPGASDAGQV